MDGDKTERAVIKTVKAQTAAIEDLVGSIHALVQQNAAILEALLAGLEQDQEPDTPTGSLSDPAPLDEP